MDKWNNFEVVAVEVASFSLPSLDDLRSFAIFDSKYCFVSCRHSRAF